MIRNLLSSATALLQPSGLRMEEMPFCTRGSETQSADRARGVN
jgi:hypothetical protein